MASGFPSDPLARQRRSQSCIDQQARRRRQGTFMAGGLGIRIATPAPGAVVARQLVVQGDVSPFDGRVDAVQVAIGGAAPQAATVSGDFWHWAGALPAGTPAGQPLTITVTAQGQLYGPPTPDGERPETPADGQRSVTVVPESTPPLVGVDGFASPVTPQQLPYAMVLSGTASDAPGASSGIDRVEVLIGDGPPRLAENPAGNWSVWRLPLSVPAGEHRITARAVDGLGNVSSVQTWLVVRVPVEPTNVDQVFELTAYLRELMVFAERYVSVGGGPGPTPEALAARLHQPYYDLVQASKFERAMARVQRSRIAIEALRRRLGGAVPAAADQRCRAELYAAVLQRLGTSTEELRQARSADAAERGRLAARLGVALEPGAARPDALDQLTLAPDAVTDEALQSLLGLLPVVATEMLPGDPAPGWLAVSRQAALRAAWQRADAADRDPPTGPRPVIDPDLVDPQQLRNREPGDAAWDLLSARTAWSAGRLAEIRAESELGDTELARLDHVVQRFIGTLDIAALSEQDADGIDIEPVLRPLALPVAALRLLARCRAALVAGVPLADQWADVHDVLLAVGHRRMAGTWRAEERAAGIVLEPQRFVADADEPESVPGPWRRDSGERHRWRATLVARAAQRLAADEALAAALDEAEAQALPRLRDALIEHIASLEGWPSDEAADRLSHELGLDLRAKAGARVVRVAQAVESLQEVLFSVRSGRLGPAPGGMAWTIAAESSFDLEWAWIGAYRTWLAAERVFAYPENQLLPTLNVLEAPYLQPTSHWAAHLVRVRRQPRVTPALARTLAAEYLAALRADPAVSLPEALKPPFRMTDQRTDGELVQLQALTQQLCGTRPAHGVHAYLWELFWYLPMSLAIRLQEGGHYLAALDWYQAVFAYHLPAQHRRVWWGLALEASIDSAYERVPEWLADPDNPHSVARTRRNAYTRFTVQSIAGCLMSYADSEFARNLPESTLRARTLYQSALALLALPDVQPDPVQALHYPDNPVWDALALRARTGLAKIHEGLNLAGLPAELMDPGQSSAMVLPSPYRYRVLIERARSHAAMAQQVEAAYLSALTAADAAAFGDLQAQQGMALARSSLTGHALRVQDAQIGADAAQVGRDKAQLEVDHLRKQLRSLSGLGAAMQIAKGGLSGLKGGGWGMLAGAGAALGDLMQQRADLNYQISLATHDVRISDLQYQRSRRQVALAEFEQSHGELQFEHAQAVLDFLATKFTGTELFEWMSRVLGDVYAYFLQQATALAQLAQAQLGFERQDRSLAFIAADYWSEAGSDAAGTEAVDRRGLTGSVRLLQDISRLDQFAFETDRRKLHLTQTLSLAEFAALELQQFRETGVLQFATPARLFDAGFPGHLLRLVKRVRVSLVALVPPVRGVRATLSTTGLSRVVVARDGFPQVVLARPPESIAFTAAADATGRFELEADDGMLLPFEGMGVDAVWRLELPRAANPFDFQQIADVLLTLDYTAIDSPEYRHKVVADLDRSTSGDRLFSLRNQFPDQWFDLVNAQTVEDPAQRMRVELPLRREDFPAHVQDLSLQHLSLLCVRKDGLREELAIESLALAGAGGRVESAGEVHTISGMASTRRPSGAPWLPFIGRDPVGTWALQLPDTPQVRRWFDEEQVEDLVLVTTVAAQTPAWN